MKKFAASLGVVSLLSGCAGGINVSPAITAFENGVIADVEAACTVEPTVASVANLFPIYGADIAAAANAICAAVNAAPAPAPAAGASGVDPNTGKTVRHNFPPVVVHGQTIYFQ